ncbi:MAG: FG-GAP repeat protein [Gammaproteobacteria bacterium]
MRIFSYSISALLLLIASLCVPAVGHASAANSANPGANPVLRGTALPAALRPVLYKTLAKDAGAAYSVNASGCATLPRQKLTACFNGSGVHFSGADSPLALHLIAWGRAGHLDAVKTVKPAIAGNRVSYAHGNLSAWWRVLPVGFEQGFTVSKPPKGNGELTLALSAGGMAKEHNGTLAWGKLRYGQLVVTDAKGKVIPATLKSQGERILIAVNDAHAVYPLTVDPLVWLEQKVTSNDGAAGDQFGISVAVSGTTAIVGANIATINGNMWQGAAYVFSESNGVWSQAAKLTASDGAAYDTFGDAVAVSGTTALVGADGHNGDQGAAYVFSESGGTWSQTAELTASDGTAGVLFGYSVALDGTTALVGAPDETVNGNASQGAAYVFGESGGTWSQTAELTASDGAFGDDLGFSVALAGNTAIVGAAYKNFAQGAAYVFGESGGTWSQISKLTASDGAAGDVFGASVVVSGTTALVGAPDAAVNDNASQGAAYVFGESGGTWSQTQKLTANDGAASAMFGNAVALSGTTALIGAPGVIINGNTHQGGAYVFGNSGGTWSQTQKLTASDGAMGAWLGYSVALDGTTALAGAWGAKVSGNSAQGAAYFEGGSDLGLAVSAPQTVGQGQQYVSQTIATNNATAASPAVAVTVAVPAAASFVSASASQGSCSETSGVVTCDFGQINGNAGTATANVTLKATGSPGTTIDNTASVALAQPPLTASAPTQIGQAGCPDGYTTYSGTLGPNATQRSPSYEAPAGMENAILMAPAGFKLYGRVDSANYGQWQQGFTGTEVHRWGPTGTYSWGVKANESGGAYTFCLQHP